MASIKPEVLELWPELEWIENTELREKTALVWERALEKSVLTPGDLNRIPFTLLCGPDLKVSFMAHKRSVVHIALESGKKMNEFYGDELPVDMDVLISGAILADVGKLLEYVLDENGKAVQGPMASTCDTPFQGSPWPKAAIFHLKCAILSLPMLVKEIWLNGVPKPLSFTMPIL